MMNVQIFGFALRQVIFTYLLEKGVFQSSASAVQPQSFLAVCGLIPAALGLAPAQNHAADQVAWCEKWFQCGLRNLQWKGAMPTSTGGWGSPGCWSGVQDSPSTTGKGWQRSPSAVVRGAIIPQELSSLCGTGNASCHPRAGGMVKENCSCLLIFRTM